MRSMTTYFKSTYTPTDFNFPYIEHAAQSSEKRQFPCIIYLLSAKAGASPV